MTTDLYELAELLAPGTGRTPGRVARGLAAAEVPVFPCVPGQKRPLTPRGFHDASTDAGQVDRWWGRWPDANLGLPTGAVSGVVVVDVDVHDRVDGLAVLARAVEAGRVGVPVFTVASPSGGRHGYYPATPDAAQRSWQTSAGVDFRGDGGYIIIPPSHTPAGNYRLETIRQQAAAGLDSDALRDFLYPRPTPESRPVRHGQSRVEPAVDVSRLAAWVAGLGEGERNRGLFWAACRAAEQAIDPTTAVDVLGAAAAHTGLGPREIATTVRSAYRTAHPTSSPTAALPAGASVAHAQSLCGMGRGL